MTASFPRRFTLGLATLVALSSACAEGTNIADGSGGSGSDPSGSTNVTVGSGGASTSSGAGSTSSGSSTSSTSSGEGGATSSTTSSTTSGTTSASSTTSSSSTGGGPIDCDPLNPAPGCGANMHCEPTTTGDPQCTPAGSGTAYALCATNAQCAGPLECVFDGFDSCCMTWCTSDFDCGFFETCEPLGTPVYVGTTAYGVCWDGYPCVL